MENDSLHGLITTLTAAEKRYFRLFAGRHVLGDKNNYLRLFEALEKQLVYNEDELAALFRGERFIRQLHRVKNYLYNILLESLEQYHALQSFDSRIKSLFRRAEVLYNKTLYGQCMKLIERAEALALQTEDAAAQLEAIRWRTRVIAALSFQGVREQELSNLMRREASLLEDLQELHRYSWLQRMFILKVGQKGLVRSSRELKGYVFIARSPLFRSTSRPRSIWTRLIYHNVLGFYHMIQGDWEGSRRHFRQYILINDHHPSIREENLRGYTAVLRNILNACLELRQYEEAYRYIEELGMIHAQSEQLKKKVFVNTSITRLNLYLLTGNTGGSKIMETIKKELEGMTDISGHELFHLYYQSACYQFMQGRYQESLQWLNRFLNEYNISTATDIHAFALILRMLVHYELGNTDLIDYMLRSTYRALSKKERLYRLENALLQFIRRKLPGIVTKEELRASFGILKSQLAEITRDPYEARALEYFDFISWLESKISGKTFAEIVREKAIKMGVRRK